MPSLVRISPTATLRPRSRTPSPSSSRPEPSSYSSPKMTGRECPAHTRQILTGTTNPSGISQYFEPPSYSLFSPNTPYSPSGPSFDDGECLSELCPGPFVYIRHLQFGGYAQAIAVRELNQSYRGPEETRLLCMKIFAKDDVLKRGSQHGVLKELLAYRALDKAVRAKGRAFVMDLEASLEDDSRLYYVMELMKHDLLAVMSENGPERKQSSRRWIAQIAMGLSAIHAAGIIHRDIKPENLLIDSQDNIRIADFSCSFVNSCGTAVHPWGEYSDVVCGTWPYLAPEILANVGKTRNERRKYTIAVDYWALGCVAFELESDDGEILFKTEDDLRLYERYNQALHQGKSYLSSARLSEDVESLISGLIRVSALNRYSIADLRRHAYFRYPDGMNEFDNMESRALSRPHTEIEVVEDYDTTLYGPMIYTPTATMASAAPNLDSFENYSWINPHGIWGSRIQVEL